MHLSLRSKLLAAFGTGAVLLCAVSLAGWQSTTRATAGLQTLYEDEAAASAALRTVNRGLFEVRTGGMAGSYITSSDDKRRADLRHDDAEWFKQIDASIAAYSETRLSPPEAQKLEEWRASYPRFIELRSQLMNMMDEAVKSPDRPNNTAESSAFRTKSVNPAVEETIRLTDELIALHGEGSTDAYHRTLAGAAQGKQMLLGILGLGVVVLLALALLLTRSIVHSVRAVQRLLTSLAESDAVAMETGLEAMARGDLAVEARPSTPPIAKYGSDEVGQTAAVANQLLASVHSTIASYEGARVSLAEIIGEVQRLAGTAADTVTHLSAATQQTGAVVQQVTSAVQSVAAGAANTSRAAQETNASVTQLSDAIDGIARGAGEQAREVQAASATASEMAQGIEQVAADATRVATASEQTKQEEMSAQIDEMNTQAQELASTAEHLRVLVARFRLVAGASVGEGNYGVPLALAA